MARELIGAMYEPMFEVVLSPEAQLFLHCRIDRWPKELSGVLLDSKLTQDEEKTLRNLKANLLDTFAIASEIGVSCTELTPTILKSL